MNLLARDPEQSLLAAVLCDRPSNPVTHTAVDWPQSLGYLTVQGSLGTHMSGAGLAIVGDSVVWPITPILQQGAWCLGRGLHGVCVIFEIVGQQCSGPGGEGCPPPSPMATGERRALLTLLNRSGPAVWHPACQRAPGFLAPDRLSPQGCRMGPLHHQIQCSKVPYRKFPTLF